MSTRSDIIAHLADGRWARIYCHFDGYLEGVGKTLDEHWTTQKKVEQLITLGDLSVLGTKVGVKHAFDPPPYNYGPGVKNGGPAYAAHHKKYNGMCRAYGRDRGEEGTKARYGTTLAEVWPDVGTWTEFTYVWDDGKWWCGDPDESTQTLLELHTLLLGEKVLQPSVKVPFMGIIGKHAALDPK